MHFNRLSDAVKREIDDGLTPMVAQSVSQLSSGKIVMEPSRVTGDVSDKNTGLKKNEQ